MPKVLKPFLTDTRVTVRLGNQNGMVQWRVPPCSNPYCWCTSFLRWLYQVADWWVWPFRKWSDAQTRVNIALGIFVPIFYERLLNLSVTEVKLDKKMYPLIVQAAIEVPQQRYKPTQENTYTLTHHTTK
jgi:hypothetical protein